MHWQPPLPWNVLVPLIAGGLVVVVWLTWRSASPFGRTQGAFLTVLRLLGVLCLLGCLLNPGRWYRPEAETQRRWVLLLDQSGSMATPDGDASGATRWQAAATLATTLMEKHPGGSKAVHWRAYAAALSPAPDAGAKPDPGKLPESDQSDALAATTTLLGASSGNDLAGIVVVGDGRQTTNTSTQETVMRARAQKIPIHTVALGGKVVAQDIRLSVRRRQWIAFPGQELQLGATLTAQGLGDVRTSLALAREGAVLETREVNLRDGEPQTEVFPLIAPGTSASYTFSTPPWEGEGRLENNTLTLHLRVITTKTRVFLAEGAPYWDSKFLAQLFRQQPYMQLRSVHRLSDTRYFQVDSDREEPLASDQDTFPETAEALAAFDLIAFGKGIEPFINEDRLAALRVYVRDHGGALLFARGRAYAGRHPGLAVLEPVVWQEAKLGSFHFRPAPEGENAGLFGESLPGLDEPVWRQLPPLQDAYQVDAVKPFTRVLARGVLPGSATDALGFPLLSVRRYGLGVVGMVNADGMWQWDFFPEARSAGNMYEEFWSQLIQWMVSYSEFLPGQQYSMRLNTNNVRVGELVSVTIGWRPESSEASESQPQETPVIHLQTRGDNTRQRTVTPAAILNEDGRPQWRATFPVHDVGEHLLRLQGLDGVPLNGPELVLTVTEPSGESDHLDADPAFLQELAAATDGRLWTAEEAIAALPKQMTQPPALLSGELEWDPLWTRWPWLLAITACFTLEWWFRRRWGSV